MTGTRGKPVLRGNDSTDSEGVVNEQVHVVVFTVHFYPRSLRVQPDHGEEVAQDVDRTCVEHTRRYFDTKTQCTYNSKNTESFAPDISFIAHRPTVSSVRETLPSLQVRTTSQWCAAPTDALLRRRMPLCLQQRTGFAEGAFG